MTASNTMVDGLDDEQFRKVVDAYVRGQTQMDLSEALKRPEVADKWYFSLIEMKRSVEAQLAARKSDAEVRQTNLWKTHDGRDRWLEAKGDYEKWRAGALRFKSGVESALQEAKNLRGPTDLELVFADRDRYIYRYMTLSEAIAKHQDHNCLDAGCPEDDDCPADLELWSHLRRSSHGFVQFKI